jgi:tetratricopeptide (TPR) repeat protein
MPTSRHARSIAPLLLVACALAAPCVEPGWADKPPPPVVVALFPSSSSPSKSVQSALVALKEELRTNPGIQLLSFDPNSPTFILAGREAGLDLDRIETESDRLRMDQAIGAQLSVTVSGSRDGSDAGQPKIDIAVHSVSSTGVESAGISAAGDTVSAAAQLIDEQVMVLAAARAMQQSNGSQPTATTSNPAPTAQPAGPAAETRAAPPNQEPATTAATAAPAPLPATPSSPFAPPDQIASKPTASRPAAVSTPPQQDRPTAATPASASPATTAAPVVSRVTVSQPPILPAAPSTPAVTDRTQSTPTAGPAPSAQPLAPEQSAPAPPVEVQSQSTASPAPEPNPVEIAPPTPMTTDAENHISDGNDAMARAEIGKAIELYRMAVDASPRNAIPRIELAKAYLANGENKLAVEQLQRAIAFDPLSSDLQTYLESAAKSGDMPGIDMLRLQLQAKSHPTDASALLQLGDDYWNSNRLDLAEQSYGEAARLPHSGYEPYARLARLYAATERYGDCLDALSHSGTAGYPAALRIIKEKAESLIGDVDAETQDFQNGKTSRADYYKALEAGDKRIAAYADFIGKIVPPPAFKVSYLHRRLAANLLAQMTPDLENYALTAQSLYQDQARNLEHSAETELREANVADRLQEAVQTEPDANTFGSQP